MADAHDTLTAAYYRLMEAVERGDFSGSEVVAALGHILRRLGPPSLTEASEIEWREANDAE